MSKELTNKEVKITKKEIARRERLSNAKKLKEWSIAVRARDGNSCSYCHATKYVHAHHIFPKEIKEFRFDIDNGIALCAKHHKYSIDFSAHKNSVAFIGWMWNNRDNQFERITDKYYAWINKNA